MNYKLRTFTGDAKMGYLYLKRRKLNYMLVSLVFLFFINSTHSFAVDYTLNGTWSNAAHWSPSYPGTNIGAGDAVYLNAASNIIDVNVTTAVGSFVKINSNKSLTINSGVTVNLNGGFLCQSPIPAKFDILGTLVINNSGADGFQVNNASQVNVLAGGTILHTGTGTCRVQGEVNNSGTLEVASGATFLYEIINPIYNFENSGVVKGEGTITVTNPSTFFSHAAGSIEPGASPGCLAINGFNNNTGTIKIEANGSTACTGYDQITSSGAVTLGGTLDISVNYSASSGDVITFIDAASISGTFASNNVPAGWTLKYNFPNTGEVSIENITPPNFGVNFNAPAICADATEWLVPIDVGTVSSDLGAVSLVLDYDNTKMTYQSIESSHANLNAGSNPIQVVDNNGKITISWASASGATISNETLMTLKFVPASGAANFSAIAGQTTNFSWDESVAGNCEFADNMAAVLNATFDAQLNVAINSLPTPGLTSDAAGNTICAGETIIFTATGGTSYEFFVDNVSQGAASATATFSSSSLTNGQVVTVKATDGNSCSATHAGITVTVNALPIPGLTSDATNDEICAGETITFTGTGGTAYEFFVDNVSQGAASATTTFSSSTLTNAQVVTVTVRDGNTCSATSSGVTVTVNALPTAGLSSDATNDEICAGETITFTGTGGTAYEFFVDNVSQGAASATATFASATLTDAQVVTVEVTDGNTCSAISSGVTVTVNATPTAGLTSDATNDEICAGETITFTGTGGGAGSNNALNFDAALNPLRDFVGGSNASLPQGNADRTIEVWFKSDAPSGVTESLFEWGSRAVANGYSGLSIQGTDVLIYNTGGTVVWGTTNVRDGQWHHVALTHSSSTNTTTMYVDGNLETSITATYNTVGTAFSLSYGLTGLFPNSIEHFTGTMDEIRVWDVTRTVSEIQATMNTSLSGSESGLVSYFNFNQGTAFGSNSGEGTIIDATGNGNGVLTGFALAGGNSNYVTGVPAIVSGSGTYEFFVDNVSQGAASSTATFSSATLTDGQVVKLTIANASGCTATSADLTVTVNPLPTTTLASDDSDNRICQGQSVTFTASSSNGADAYIFVSSIDNEVQAQSATATYTDAGLQDGEVISVFGVNTSTGCSQVAAETFTFDVDACHSVSGNLVYKNSAETAMGNVVITITGPGLAANTTVTTDVGDGGFTVPNLFDNETYTFGYATTKTHGGINSTDALYALLDAVSIINLTGLNETTADVTNDNIVAGGDALQIQLRFVGAVNSFAAGDWVFDAGSFTINGGNSTGNKLYALATGDINGSYTPNSAENDIPTVSMINDDQLTINDGDRIQIPVRIKNGQDVGAMSLSMFFPSNAMTIHDVTLADGSSLLYNVSGNEVRMAWADMNSKIFADDDILYYVDATINDVATYTGAPLGVNTASELADGTGQVLDPVTLGVPTITGTVTSTNAIELAATSVRSFPNPFQTQMTIEYDLSSTSNVQIQMFNSLGQELTTLVSETQSEGTHRAIWTAENQTAGVYYYTITVTEGNNSYKQTKQVILVK
jgi:hypothetical protein